MVEVSVTKRRPLSCGSTKNSMGPSVFLAMSMSPNPALPGGIFTNRFWNGSFYRRISPTSFYAMLAGAPTDQQVATHHACAQPGAVCLPSLLL